MKIAVFGWYGHDNAGDERIKYCLNKFLRDLGGIETIDFFDLHENATKGKTNKFDGYDLVIIGGGGIVLSQANYHDFILGINTKIITIGVSVETELKNNPGKFAQALIEKSLVFLVRDQGSFEKLLPLDKDKKVKVSADLTFLEPYSVVNIDSTNKIGINLLPKALHFKHSTLNTPLGSFIINQLDRLNLLNALKVVNFEKLINQLKEQFELKPIPFYFAAQKENLPLYQKNDVAFLKQYFENVPHSFNDSDMNQCRMFISMRLHGAIFAIQKGIPVITFSTFPKHINFIKEVGLEHTLANVYNLAEIPKIIEYIENNVSVIKDKIIFFREKAVLQIQKNLIETMNLI